MQFAVDFSVRYAAAFGSLLSDLTMLFAFYNFWAQY